MKLVYFSKRTEKEDIDEQIAFFVLSYIISNEIMIVCFPGLLMVGYKFIDIVKEDQLIFFLRSTSIYEPEKLEKNIEVILMNKKIVDKIKKNKHKSKIDYVTIHRYEVMINTLRQMLFNTIDSMIINTGFKPFIKLLTNDIIIKGYNFEDPETATKEDSDLIMLFDLLSECNSTPLLNKNIIHQFKSKDISNDNNKEIIDFDFLNFTIFSIPYVKDGIYTTESLINFRNQILPKFKNNEEKIATFLNMTINKKFDKSIENEFRILHDSMFKSESPFQNVIDNNIYIQKIKNTEKNMITLQLNLCITSLNVIVDYYKVSEDIKPYMASTLKDKLRLTTDLDSCKSFYYIDIIEPFNN